MKSTKYMAYSLKGQNPHAFMKLVYKGDNLNCAYLFVNDQTDGKFMLMDIESFSDKLNKEEVFIEGDKQPLLVSCHSTISGDVVSNDGTKIGISFNHNWTEHLKAKEIKKYKIENY